MNIPSICFLDLIGLVYDGDTLKNRGLGGSESATILMARELAAIGFPVTVFNTCNVDGCKPGVYDGVTYRPIKTITSEDKFDIAIALRTVQPFVPDNLFAEFDAQPPGGHGADELKCELFKPIRDNAKLKILWMHDTFCRGDQHIEDLVINGHINKIFTLSDFHTSYITTCDHGKRRNFEVLKRHVFMTRNGIDRHIEEVDISQKDPNLFVFNASISKGMMPLIDGIWPVIRAHIPQARLKIIGGYYQFRKGAPLDAQGESVSRLITEQKYKDLGIEFTGIITQKEIAGIMAKASMFLFPGSFPETFGISTLEALNYNTPLVASRFGALEETALEQACYLLDYAIEPNSLFPNINVQDQIRKFIDVTLKAHGDRYLHQQKQYYCNVIKDISTWDTVALQWKQFFFKNLGLYLSADEYRKVSYINNKVHKIFGRRFSNPVEWTHYKRSSEAKITIVSPFYNSESYLERLINSVATQDYDNYSIYLVDDRSTDNSVRVAKAAIDLLPDNIKDKFHLSSNMENLGAVFNQVNLIRALPDRDIIMLLDGDDALMPDNNILNFYNNLFADDKTEYAYGSCWSLADSIPLIAQPYPDAVKKSKQYRNHKFNWNMPYPHLRVFKKKLINSVDDSVFKDENGNWFKAGGDNATFYNIIEQADPDKVVAVQEINYLYNDMNPLNDYKVHGELQNQTAAKIMGKEIPSPNPKPSYKIVEVDPRTIVNPIKQGMSALNRVKKKILIAIPTARNIEATTFKSIYDLEVPDGYETTFQFFFGYQVDQVRNLIADWVVNGKYDYLFSVDSDISFAPDTLKKFIEHDVDAVSGVYRQRNADVQIIELFDSNDQGGFTHIPYERIKGKGLVEVGAMGFGCALIKHKVFADIGYPQFQYHSAINHANTFSEDLDFCRKAKNKGFRIYADTSVICDHHGAYTFKVQ
ncbi:Glyco_tranf_GTA_type domain containing protein [uncultured Caudovirales phage]|uniref:Glyco_tranf_GTA_type domain containing protein n=1 Tax=uncultured Caudovirales phage TaxID=2100421 RepID=A0A6J7WU55_9CAUD|nr:Glyco_tranf_GTA_type domain containing protein [uncultured Caudovirales phage]